MNRIIFIPDVVVVVEGSVVVNSSVASGSLEGSVASSDVVGSVTSSVVLVSVVSSVVVAEN